MRFSLLFTAYPQQFTGYTVATMPFRLECNIGKDCSRLNLVDKYKTPIFGLKVGKSVILCQQVVNLEIFIHL